MRALALIAAVTFALAGLLPAAAHARGQTVTVEVRTDPRTSQPVGGAKVEILGADGTLLGSGITDAKGEAVIKFELSEGTNNVAITTDAQGPEGRRTYTTADMEHASPDLYRVYLPPSVASRDSWALLALAKRAIAKCDKAEYDQWVAEVSRRVSQLERELDDEQKRVDEFARQNNLHITDLKGAQKDLKRAEKAQEQIDPGARNTEALEALDTYIRALEGIETIKKELEDARKARDGIPPFPADCKKDKVGMVPGTGKCPDGSGGMLAGALNQIFDSDLAAACADKSRRRDTEREKHEDRKGGKKD